MKDMNTFAVLEHCGPLSTRVSCGRIGTPYPGVPDVGTAALAPEVAEILTYNG